LAFLHFDDIFLDLFGQAMNDEEMRDAEDVIGDRSTPKKI